MYPIAQPHQKSPAQQPLVRLDPLWAERGESHEEVVARRLLGQAGIEVTQDQRALLVT